MCLAVSLALVTLSAISSHHMQQEQEAEYGTDLAQQIARRVGAALESGDLVSIAASLQRFVATSNAQQVAIIDIEGRTLGEAGSVEGVNLQQYRAPIKVEQDIAGEVLITVNTDTARAAQIQLIVSLGGLAVLLSLAVYGGVRHFGQKLAERLSGMAKAVSLEGNKAGRNAGNELDWLQHNIEQLPMDLLRTRSTGQSASEEHYHATAVAYIHLTSLADYVDTLDENALHRYTNRLHQIVYAAAGFYDGQLQVSRQFGLAIYFSGPNSAGSPAFRAACCTWLIKQVAEKLEKQMSLSLGMAIAIDESELGAGDESDIYPGLYMQSTLDELQAVCANRPPKILLAPGLAQDIDVASRLDLHATELFDYQMLEGLAGSYRDLLDRQLRLILKRLSA